MDSFDVAIVGGGPAGSTCAAFCAVAGLRTLVLERERFPREKVCGDCINPACWPVLERLQVAESVRALPHSDLESVDFIAIDGTTVRVALPLTRRREIAVKRSLFDNVLLDRARQLGSEVRDATTVSALEKNSSGIWRVTTHEANLKARVVIAADGRNSTIARLRNLLPRAQRERIALQTHIPLPPDFGKRVVLQFLKQGYSGQAPVNDSELNLCLVAKPVDMAALKEWALKRFALSRDHPWRTITPLTRAALRPGHENVFLIGDAARVVEPFTGEGIYYALRSGELAAAAVAKIIRGRDGQAPFQEFEREHAAIYRGRLWINRMARAAVLSPRIASIFVHLAQIEPAALRLLTGRIVRS
jgi:menaquinone-9 beta-reductase